MLIMVGIQNTDPAAQVLATRSGVALEIASLTPPPPAATTGHHTNMANTDIGAGVPGRGWVGSGAFGHLLITGCFVVDGAIHRGHDHHHRPTDSPYVAL